jgi:hypothetical protein
MSQEVLNVPETINWSFSVEVVQGPRISGSDALEVDAYDKVSVDPAVGDTEVQVQPADAAKSVHLLVIRADAYDVGIEFSAGDGTTKFSLDAPVVLIGSGAVSLLSSAPQTLEFNNSGDAAVRVDILVGRDSSVP